MALFVDTSDFPTIRALIDVSITPHDLSDDIIKSEVFLAAAEQEVLGLDPDAATRTGEDQQRIKRAVMYFTAANLVPSVVRITSQTVNVRDSSFSRQTFDVSEKVAELRGKAFGEISAVIDPDEDTPARPTMFTTVPGYRGR